MLRAFSGACGDNFPAVGRILARGQTDDCTENNMSDAGLHGRCADELGERLVMQGFKGLPMPMFVIDEAHRVVLLEPASCERITGIPADFMVRQGRVHGRPSIRASGR
jgi:hypothetical protein